MRNYCGRRRRRKILCNAFTNYTRLKIYVWSDFRLSLNLLSYAMSRCTFCHHEFSFIREFRITHNVITWKNREFDIYKHICWIDFVFSVFHLISWMYMFRNLGKFWAEKNSTFSISRTFIFIMEKLKTATNY